MIFQPGNLQTAFARKTSARSVVLVDGGAAIAPRNGVDNFPGQVNSLVSDI
jgi:hypothetical protein